MIDKSHYALITCSCDASRYLENAFSLLDCDISKHSLDSVLASGAADNLVVATCSHNLTKLDAGFTSSCKANICVTDGSIDDNLHALPIIKLSYPFTIYQFKNALLRIDAAHDISNSVDDSIFDELVGESLPIKKIKQVIRQVANSDSNILILGQSGTGKEVIASAIHHLSSRHEKPFVPLNCGAIPSELMESELFGHEKGAFTGAVNKRPGRFELANTGTLFLDEIGDMPLQMQVKLLRVIQDKKVERIGSTTSINVDVRLIAATNKNLENMISNNLFREDLYYRLNVIPIHVPTLSERSSDIPLLINNQLDRIRKRIPHQAQFSEGAINILMQYDWPGNIRELANFIERMVVLYQDKVIEDNDVSEQLNRVKSKQHQFILPDDIDNFNMKAYLSTIEQQIINIALEKSNGIVSSAAEYLNLGRTTLIEKMKKYKLVTNE